MPQGRESSSSSELGGLGAEIVVAEEPERLGRGGGIKFAARSRSDAGDVFALNGDELVAVDFVALLAAHRAAGGARDADRRAAEVAVRPGRGRRPERRPRLPRRTRASPTGSTAATTCCPPRRSSGFPDRGDHESSTFPELAAEGRLHAYRHEGLWLTVNTPKELRVASEHVAAHPEWLA